MAPRSAARLRLLALCIAILCQTGLLATVARLSLNQHLDGSAVAYDSGVIATWLALLAIPGLLAAVLGPCVRTLGNRAVLIGASAVVVVLLLSRILVPSFPLTVLGPALVVPIVAFGIAALTMLPALARETGWTTLPVTAFCFFGASGLVAFVQESRNELDQSLVLSILSLIAILPVKCGVEHSSRPRLLRQLFTGVQTPAKGPLSLAALVGLWMWGFILGLVLLAVVRIELAADPGGFAALLNWPVTDMAWGTAGFLGALKLGIVLPAVSRHDFRYGGFILMGATLAFGASLWLALGGLWGSVQYPIGFALGLCLGPLLHYLLTWTSPQHHGVATSLVFAGWCGGALVLAGILFAIGPDPAAARGPLVMILAVTTGLAALGACLTLFRPAMELTAEIFISPNYRVSATGPGAAAMPARGPYLVIANHSAWFDPLFIAKIVAAPIVAMMTSKFYDLPVLSFLMRRIVGTIRVPDAAYRHEAPELKDAVAALDRGDALIVFPEGYLRRKEEVLLRRFGRGIWKILQDRPDTPIFACWIEGNWGSYTSFMGGPPVKGKRIDWWRPIRIGVVGPIRLDAATLADHMATRTALMAEVARAREPLGLEPLALAGLPEGDEA